MIFGEVPDFSLIIDAVNHLEIELSERY